MTTKIKYIKLENFKGIYSGLQRKTVEFNLDQSDNKLVLLKGGNGSGKSTILSTLHPYRETFDDRKSPVMEDEDGYKEIHIQRFDNEFVIKHIYGKKNKSYITKNGTELNENGNITSFVDIVEKELEVTKDYFVVGKLGSMGRDFIDYKTVERKKYINLFVPDMDQYLDAYENIKNKFSDLKSRLKNLNSELTMYDSMGELTENDNLFTKRITELEERLAANNKEIALNDNKLSINLTEVKENTPDSLLLENTDNTEITDFLELKFKQLEVEVQSINLEIDNLLNSPNKKKLAEYSSQEMAEKTNAFMSKKTVETEMRNVNITSINELAIDVEELKGSRIKKELEKESMVTPDPDGVAVEKASIIDSMSKLKSVIDSYSGPSVITRDSYNYLPEKLSTLSSLVGEVDSAHTPEIDKLIEQHGDIAKVKDYLYSLYTINEEDKSRHRDLSTQYNSIKNRESFLTELDHTKTTCTIDTCPFVALAISYKEDFHSLGDMYNVIVELENKINTQDAYLQRPDVNIGNLENAKGTLDMFLSANKDITELFKGKEFNFVTIDSVVTISNKATEYFNAIISTENLEKNLMRVESLENDIIRSKKEYAQLCESINEIKVKEDKLVEKLNSLKQEKVDRDLKLTKIENNLLIMSSFSKVLQKKQETHDELSLVTQVIERNKDLGVTREALLSNQTYLTSIDGNTTEEIQVMRKRSKENSNKLAVVESISKRLSEIDKVLPIYTLVNDSLDPKKGIPLIFSKTYLDSIQEEANKLLSIAYDGAFLIEFKVEAKEFAIRVFKDDGTMLDDINQASQGERSLTNLSLSLAMLGKITKGYDVLYLDEVDGVLSTDNRRKFIEMLEKQTEHLGISQVFIISHNDDFFSNNMDLVLLRDNGVDLDDKDFMEGKCILFDYSDIPESE